MKINEALKVIDAGWVRKPKGFRVHFQKRAGAEIVTDYSPGLDDSPLDSDVVAWRLAWKLAQAAKGDSSEKADEAMFNIYVVDDAGNPIRYYATNQVQVFNAQETEALEC